LTGFGFVGIDTTFKPTPPASPEEDMRFTADYDSEEEEFPVNNASRETTPFSVAQTDTLYVSSEDESYDDDAYCIDSLSPFNSPKSSREAWVRPPSFLPHQNQYTNVGGGVS
jgi:hypothetical protein